MTVHRIKCPWFESSWHRLSKIEQRTEATITQLASTEEHIRRQADCLHSIIDEQEAALFKRAQDTSDQRLNLIQQRKESANNALAKASVYSETEPATTDKGVRFYKELSDKIAAVLKDGDDTINTPLPPEVQVDLVMKETATERIVQSSHFGQVVCLSQPAGPSDRYQCHWHWRKTSFCWNAFQV